MEWISQIPVFGGAVSTLLAFVAVLGVVVFVHEYGHYIVGRMTGIGAEVFSMGFGPVIWSRTDKRGMKWQIAAVPLGGYVKFIGDRDPASATVSEELAGMDEDERSRSFPAAKLWKRAATVLAGPVANFLLAIVIFTGLVLAQGVATERPTVGEILDFPDTGYDLRQGDVVLAINGQTVEDYADIYSVTVDMDPPGDMAVTVERDGSVMTVRAPYLFPAAVYGVEPLSAADEAGLKKGDIILAADGKDLVTFMDLKKVVEASRDKEIVLTVWRDGQAIDMPITPKLREYPDGEGGFEERVMIGVSGSSAFLPATETPSVLKAVELGGKQVYGVIATSLNAIKNMFVGELSPSNLQGPIGIAQMSQATANQGVISFLSFIAIISVGIGMLNLFPIPMLDGGHLLFYAFEAIRGKPLPNKTIERAVSIGLAMVLLLMVFVTYNDILKF